MSAIPYSTFEQDFKFQKNLGQGNCASVVQVYHTIDKQSYALKRIVVPTSDQLFQAVNEIQSICMISDEKATKVYYYYSHHNKQKGNFELGIIMELCKQSLSQLIRIRKKKHEFFKTEDVRIFLTSLAPFFAKMQKKGILHRDIKPDNILLAKSKKTDYRVADFGFAIQENIYSSRNVAGTMQYVSPKLLVKFKDHKISVPGHNIKDDVYSFGKTLSQFMTLDINGPFTQRKISQCTERYGKQYTNVILMTTKQIQAERIDFIMLQEYLLTKNLIDTDYLASRNIKKSKSPTECRHSVSPTRSKQYQVKTKANCRTSRGYSPQPQLKTKRKLTSDQGQSTLSDQTEKQRFGKKLFMKGWEKKIIPLKQQVQCLQICDTLLFLALQNKLGVMIMETGKLMKFTNISSLKSIYYLKVSQDSSTLLLGTLQGKICCIPMKELKKLMLTNTDSYKMKNCLDISLQGMKCKEYSLTAPISTFEVYYPDPNADPTLIVGHLTGEITIVSNNRQQRKFPLSNWPITHIVLSEGLVYTSTTEGVFRKQLALTIGLTVENENKVQKVRNCFKNQVYQCKSTITTFKIITGCKRNLQIKNEDYHYMAILVCWNGEIRIISKDMQCQKMIRVSHNCLHAAFLTSSTSNDDHGVDGYFVDEEGTIVDLDGKIVSKTEEKELVCIRSNGQNIYCGGFQRKIVALKAKEITINLQ